MTAADSKPPHDSAGPQRARRSDAQRNYELLLAAAREVFHERGVDAPLDDIARRAGIGNATMYRHFPARRDLLVAVYADEVTALCDLGESLLDSRSPVDALFAWLGAFVTHVATKRDLALSIPDDGGQRSVLFQRWHQSMHTVAARLLKRAQSSGAAPGASPRDLLTLASGIATTSAGDEQALRCLDLLRRGVAPQVRAAV